MKQLLTFLIGGALALVSCAKDDQTPPGEDKTKALDGVWATQCMNKQFQQSYRPYIAEIVFKRDHFYQKFTSYSDEKCQVQAGEPLYTVAFKYEIGRDVEPKPGKAFNFSWDFEDELGQRFEGTEHNFIAVNGLIMQFRPLYEPVTDENDGTTPEKRFRKADTAALGHAEKYVRQTPQVTKEK